MSNTIRIQSKRKLKAAGVACDKVLVHMLGLKEAYKAAQPVWASRFEAVALMQREVQLSIEEMNKHL